MASKSYIQQIGQLGDAAGILKQSQQIADKNGMITQSWWRSLSILFGPPQQEAPVILGPSPTTLTVPSDCQILIQGGTVSLIEYTRKNTYTLGFTSGYFPLSDNDSITITYTVAPTVTYFPC